MPNLYNLRMAAELILIEQGLTSDQDTSATVIPKVDRVIDLLHTRHTAEQLRTADKELYHYMPSPSTFGELTRGGMQDNGRPTMMDVLDTMRGECNGI